MYPNSPHSKSMTCAVMPIHNPTYSAPETVLAVSLAPHS